MLFFFDWRIALVGLAGFGLFEFVNLFMRLAVKNVSADKYRDDAAEIGKVLEYIQGIAEVKAYNLSGDRRKELNEVIDRRKKTLIKMEMRCIPVSNLQSLVAKLTGVAMMIATTSHTRLIGNAYMPATVVLPKAFLGDMPGLGVVIILDIAGGEIFPGIMILALMFVGNGGIKAFLVKGTDIKQHMILVAGLGMRIHAAEY